MNTTSGIEIPTYFAPGAFAMAREEATGITYDPEQLAAISSMAEERFGRPIPTPLENIAFIYRFGTPGHEQPIPDPSFYKVSPTERYVHASELSLPIDRPPHVVTKAHIEADRTGFQIQVRDFKLPLAGALAETLVYPPAEDHRIKASAGAWLRQVGEAFQPRKMSPERRNAFIKEAAAEFAGAIVLRPRPRAIGT